MDQGQVRRGRLRLEDVDGGSRELPRIERVDERGLVDEASPRAVDDPGGRLHRPDRLGVDQVARLRGQRGVEADEVAAGPEVVRPSHALDAVL